MLKRKNAFTLVEVLTVIAITAILMSLLLAPMIQSFIMARKAQSYIQAQTTSRVVLEQITRELANAVYVFDNSNDDAAVDIWLFNRGGDKIAIPVKYAKIDFILPAQGPEDINNPNAVTDPTVNKPIGQMIMPLGPGVTMVRYFIGLRDNTSDNAGVPTIGYNNIYDNPFASQDDPDNMYVLYRAEVQVTRLVNGVVRVNTDLFDEVQIGGQYVPVINDPKFFYKNPQRAAAWKAASRIVVEVSDSDMVHVLRDPANNNAVIFKSINNVISDSDLPDFRTLLSFVPEAVQQENTIASYPSRSGVEVVPSYQEFSTAVDPATSENLIATEVSGVAPTQFRTRYGGWGSEVTITMYRTPQDANFVEYYQTQWVKPTNGSQDPNTNLVIYRHRVLNGVEQGTPEPIFNITAYRRTIKSSNGPCFMTTSNGLTQALVADTTDYDAMPFVIDERSGTITTSFQHDVMETDPAYRGKILYPVGPMVSLRNPTPPVSADLDNINGRYRYMMLAFMDSNSRTELDVRRFINLKYTGSPLERFRGSTIVPGSEEVYGPDQNPGANWGKEVRYTRVPANSSLPPGRNQYKINYVALLEKENSTDKAKLDAIYQRLDDLCKRLSQEPPNHNLGDLQILAKDYYMSRFDVGYVEFCSDPNIPIPYDNSLTEADNVPISVSYQFQVNRPGDRFVVDYSTSELMTISMGIRRYDNSGSDAQMFTMSSQVQLRNFLRN